MEIQQLQRGKGHFTGVMSDKGSTALQENVEEVMSRLKIGASIPFCHSVFHFLLCQVM